jgi:hypothetical protein
MASELNNLGIHDTEVLVEFLLYHMPMETRFKLMTEYPIVYAKLFPEVDPAFIITHVVDGIRVVRADADRKAAIARAERG